MILFDLLPESIESRGFSFIDHETYTYESPLSVPQGLLFIKGNDGYRSIYDYNEVNLFLPFNSKEINDYNFDIVISLKCKLYGGVFE